MSADPLPVDAPDPADRRPPRARTEGDRLVLREPLRDTLVPLAALGALDLAACFGVALGGSIVRVACFLVAAGVSFPVAALAVSLLRRPEVVFDAGAGLVRMSRGGGPAVEVPLADVVSVGLVTVTPPGGGEAAPAAAVRTRDGRWLPLHLGRPASGAEGESGARAVAAAVGEFLGLPPVAGRGA